MSSSSSSSSSSFPPYDDTGSTFYSIPTSAVYPLCDFADASGMTWELITSGGKLYKTAQASGSYTELLDTNIVSFDWNSPVVDAVRVGAYVYLVDGNHAMIRVSLDGGFPAYSQQPPVKSPTVSLTDVTLDTPTSVQWFPGPLPLTQANLVTNGYFDVTGAVSGNVYLPGAPWTVGGGKYVLPTTSPDYGQFSATAGHSIQRIAGHNFSLLVDDPADGVQQPVTAPYLQTTAWPATNNLARAACFQVGVQGFLQTPGSSASLYVSLSAIAVGGSIITTQDAILTPSNTSDWSQMTACFNFTQSLSSDPDHYLFSLASGPNNVSGNGIWIAAVTLNAIANGPFLSDMGGGQVKWSANFGNIGGSFIVRDYGSGGKSFANVGTLGFVISSSSITPLSDLYLRFGLVATTSSSSSSSSSSSGSPLSSSSSSGSGFPFDGGGTIVWSNPVRYNDAGSFGYADITTVPASTLASVRYLFIQVILDLPTGDIIPGTPTNIITFGPLSAAGDLSIGYQYVYYVTEKAKIDASNIIESNPSAPSAAVTTSVQQAETDIVIPADCPVNAATNEYTLYRLGGTWADVREIATVSKDTDVAYGADPLNPNYSWDHTTRTFLDNTPDTALALANLMSFGRYPMPANGQCIALYNGHPFQGNGNRVNIGWLFNGNNSQPLYTTLIQTDGDPNLPEEGASFPISPDPSDTIVRMVPYGTPVAAANAFGGGLAIFCKRSVWTIQGTNAENFTLQQLPYTEGVGLVAFRGVTRIDANTMAFLGPDRVHMFPPNLDSPDEDQGQHIQTQIYPIAPQVLQDQTAFSKSWLLFHDQKVLMGCPVPGGTQNSVIWVYDLRVQGWSRWTGPQAGGAFPLPGMATTGAVSMPPTTNGAQYDLYLYSLDGQIYRMTGTTDRYTPLSATAPIPFTVTAAALRPQFYALYTARPVYYAWARLEMFEVEMVMSGSLTMVAQAFRAGTANPAPIAGAISTQTYGLSGGGRTFRVDLPPGLITGAYVELTLSGAVTDVAYLRGLRGYVSAASYEQGP